MADCTQQRGPQLHVLKPVPAVWYCGVQTAVRLAQLCCSYCSLSNVGAAFPGGLPPARDQEDKSCSGDSTLVHTACMKCRRPGCHQYQAMLWRVYWQCKRPPNCAANSAFGRAIGVDQKGCSRVRPSDSFVSPCKTRDAVARGQNLTKADDRGLEVKQMCKPRAACRPSNTLGSKPKGLVHAAHLTMLFKTPSRRTSAMNPAKHTTAPMASGDQLLLHCVKSSAVWAS